MPFYSLATGFYIFFNYIFFWIDITFSECGRPHANLTQWEKFCNCHYVSACQISNCTPSTVGYKWELISTVLGVVLLSLCANSPLPSRTVALSRCRWVQLVQHYRFFSMLTKASLLSFPCWCCSCCCLVLPTKVRQSILWISQHFVFTKLTVALCSFSSPYDNNSVKICKSMLYRPR